ncbi:uncharacterized protein BO88DRAFT_425013 [Aspergillus vadensis CBS 113365]|uniref:Uncharacterized protein n=1 Tax=Aspergillus vadensis (strain CBS 113365 / IMI 142717 / IBT 24658) TaxID=1448311 RepID=A0A319BDL3_ASPVC|nr:hypothetical protein BO88DRAFT_425013 [Aspergillus vadensis CBS 113365]PYH70074.1 hypothetical protein BO88DRAFT_425013 [Aspergillus vadensis CBS 113365]
MILDYLPPTDLIRVFCSSKIALDYGASFMRREPKQFYRCLPADDEGNLAIDSMSPTVDVCAPTKSNNHAYGFRDSFAILPIDLQAITVYGVRMEGHIYVCGIDLRTRSTNQRIGTHSELVSQLYPIHDQIDVICFLLDAVGIRSLKFGRSEWSFGDPKRDQCWEGLSIRRGEGRLKVVRDALKFRHIGWCSDTTVSFPETLLMQKSHAFWNGHIDETHYIAGDPQDEKDMVSNIGNFTVEALWLTENLSGVTFYSASGGIQGITIHYSSGGTSTAGQTNDRHEVLAKVVVRVLPQFRFPFLKVNAEEVYSSLSLKPPKNCYIKGFYFRIVDPWIESIGIIYDDLEERSDLQAEA